MEYTELDVLIQIGRDGKCFTYKDGLGLGVNTGDLVRVRLKKNFTNGLVVGKRVVSQHQTNFSEDNASNQFTLLNIEALIQPAAVDPNWSQWIDQMALDCFTSRFRMLKTALPPGWLGQNKNKSFAPKLHWWISLLDIEKSQNNVTKRQKDLENFLRESGGGAWLRTLNKMGFSNVLVNNFIKKGGGQKEKKERKDICDTLISQQTDLSELLEKEQVLTKEQKSAVDSYNGMLKGSALLLWGVTGSGKTEVYLQIASKEIQKGKHCLILTPEIGLIPQLVDRFSNRFGKRVLEYHSNRSKRERIEVWKKILETDEPKIVIGTRSSVFLPLAPLGVIVLDEEHDTSYKQESPMPCYHAREIALSRAEFDGAKVILGSATPSLATWKRLVPDGKILLAKLERRISQKPLPYVDVIDMRDELARGNRRLLSYRLLNRLQKLKDSNEQAVILVPKRGYSSFLSCRSCGEVVQCPHCDVALTIHQTLHKYKWLRCHWCDHKEDIRNTCSSCGSIAFKPFGAGTQRVMEHLEKELKDLKIMRFDRDSTTGKEGHRKILDKFASQEADILVGTQMLAKGMDLPNVTLAVVLAADGVLHRPDLSAEEQALQLFMQLAGRAGRGDRLGDVIVQTYCPEHPVITHLKNGSYEQFLKSESELRKKSGLFPYSRACLLRLSGGSESLTASAASELLKKIKPYCEKKGWTISGPAPAQISRIAGRSRWQILLHGPESSRLPLPYGPDLWAALPQDVSLSVDPDPLNL